MKSILMFAALGILVSCGKGHDGSNGRPGLPGITTTIISTPPATIDPTDPDQQDIEHLVSLKNEFRVLNGGNPLTKNLMCKLYTFTGGDRIQASISGHNTLSGLVLRRTFEYNGPFNQPDSPITDGMNVLPEPLKTQYTNMYMIRCEGFIVVQDSGYYKFDLASDDASVLYIAGSKLIDNDNNHGTTLVTGTKLLERGIHAFRLDYAQAGGGSQSLVLKVNDQSIDAKYYYR